ncbi:unnamed protein product [Mycena citricolor]|uniref:Uncharacterized protein n=1 Tax=Mycena citricolor TaxID=2018698 RepID=A0AAD2Q769_9AGAR|nr:unnamed protein product [Mycena citricolor]
MVTAHTAGRSLRAAGTFPVRAFASQTISQWRSGSGPSPVRPVSRASSLMRERTCRSRNQNAAAHVSDDRDSQVNRRASDGFRRPRSFSRGHSR